MTLNVLAFCMYFLISVICGVACILSFFNILRYTDHTPTTRFLSLSMLSAAVMSFSDFVHAVRVFQICSLPDWFYMTTYTLYTLACVASGYFWFLYSENAQHSVIAEKKLFRIFFHAIFVAMALFVVSNPFHSLCFSFAGEEYSRGPLFLWLVVPNVLIVLYSGITSLVRSFQSRYYVKRGAFRDLFLFSVLLLGFLFFQYLVPDLPLRTLGYALVFFIVQNHIIKNNIYRDRIAQINNRLVLENYMSSHFDSADGSFCLGLLDIVNFRSINEQYGYETGDRALLLTARALKATAGSAVVARLENDEFAFSGHYGSEREVEVFLAAFRKKLKEILQEEKMDLDLRFHLGLARKTPEVASVPVLVNRAREALHESRRKEKA